MGMCMYLCIWIIIAATNCTKLTFKRKTFLAVTNEKKYIMSTAGPNRNSAGNFKLHTLFFKKKNTELTIILKHIFNEFFKKF